ncbi:hypothetical protein [Halorubrum aethiopicum]|uniref:hypothetical protein n=1 Tax=Halorubrum aethiopicum TaxID=1758255 RepID=UPI00083567E6|nr:hypothetical protein [Halorubrum aethiopicum]
MNDIDSDTESDTVNDTEYGTDSDTADETNEKTLNDVYHDRNLLACALAVATGAPSGWKPAPDAGDEWAIVWIETPMGQTSWHVLRDLAESIGPAKRDSEYDGYSREQKNDVLASWAEEGCWY